MKRGPVLFVVTTLVVATLIVVAAVVASCQGTTAGSPTPFPTPGASLTVTIPNAAAVDVTISELSTNPGLYEGAILRVSGRFQRQPLLVCDADPHPSPATWGLAEEGLTTLANGMDQQLRSLLPEDLTMTAEGRWRRWQGLVGCGKSAQARDFYYLEVGRVLSPSPLTMVTLTPDPNQEPTAIAEIPPVITPTLALRPTLSVTEEATATLALTPTETSELPVFPTQAETTPDFEQTPSPTGSTLITPTQLATPTSPLGGTATTRTPTVTGTPPTATPGTPGITGTPGTMTPTVTGTPPTATPTLNASNTDNQGDIFGYDYESAIVHLDANETHSWDADLFTDDAIIVQVIAPAPADLRVSVVKDGQVIIPPQNLSAAGIAEILPLTPSAGEDIYQVLVETTDGSATDYSLTAYYTAPSDFVDYAYILSGFLTPGTPRNNQSLPADTYHIWFFVGQAGDTVTITVSPNGEEDPNFTLYWDSEDNSEYIDDGEGGDDEVLLEFNLLSDGLHAIALSEISDESMNYNISLTVE